MHPSLLADSYPIGLRGRMAAATTMAIGLSGVLSPLAMGGIATLLAAEGGWRWSFIIVAVPIIGDVLRRLYSSRTVVAGSIEKADVLGTVIDDQPPAPVSMEAAFERIMRIRDDQGCASIAFSAIGFGLFTGPVLANLFLQRQYHLDALRTRRDRSQSPPSGWWPSCLSSASTTTASTAKTRRRPSALLGHARSPSCALDPGAVLHAQCLPVGAVRYPLSRAPLHRLRDVRAASSSRWRRIASEALTSAVGAIYIFFIGALGGAILSALLTDPLGPRGAFLSHHHPRHHDRRG